MWISALQIQDGLDFRRMLLYSLTCKLLCLLGQFAYALNEIILP